MSFYMLLYRTTKTTFKKYFTFSLTVSTSDVTLDEQSVADNTLPLQLNEHVSPSVKSKMCNTTTVAETSSVDYPMDHLLKKPKPGVFQKVNLVLRRMFNSKL